MPPGDWSASVREEGSSSYRQKALLVTCAACGFENPPGFRFCGGCGGALSAPAEAAERRRLTVMFCDMVGSTSLSERLDPEELREVVASYHARCTAAIERHGGHVAQLLGDGLVVYFGYPRAHGDDARRAVQAAMDILASLERVQVRIGIHTGLVVIGELGHGSRTNIALGETPNLAARLQSLAEVGTAVISAETLRLVVNLFRVEDLGERAVKGISRPLRVYRVLEAVPPEEVAGTGPLLGRDAEMARLEEAWQRARRGEGGVVLLRGTSGMGRSRLAQELRSRVRAEGANKTGRAGGGRCLTLWSSATHQGTSLYPVIDLLERMLGGRSLDRLEVLPEAARPYIAALLNLAPPPPVSPQALKARILAHLVGLLRSDEPLLVTVEDFHLADPTTAELVQMAAAEAPARKLLLLLISDRRAWLPGAEVVDLDPLPSREVERLVRSLAPDLDEGLVRNIVERSDGVPVYARELTRAVLDTGAMEDIPATLYDSLMARLDRHAEAREAAQLGATIGRRFALELIRELASTEVDTHLSHLVRGEVLDRQGLPPRALYAFHSALVQEAAYQSLLKSIRQTYHERIALTLEKSFPEVAENQPEFLAHHFTEGHRFDRAVDYWRRAGERAMELSACPEAVRCFHRALELAGDRPDLELGLRMAVAPALIATRGYASPEVEECYGRARELCARLGNTVARFPVLAGLWVFHLVRGQLARSQELASQLLDLAGEDPTLLLLAHTAAGETALWQGRLADAREHLETALAHHDPQRHGTLHLVYFGTDPAVGSLSYLSWGLWLVGEPAAALERSQRALDLARELRHPHSLAHALGFACWLRLNVGDAAGTAAAAAEVVALAEEQAFPLWHAVGRVFRGLLRAPEEIGPALQDLQGTGTLLGASFFMALTAQLYAASGQVEQGLGMLDLAQSLEEGWWEPEIHRIRGDLTGSADAWREALRTARDRGALSLELRAALSLQDPELVRSLVARFPDGAPGPELAKAAQLLGR